MPVMNINKTGKVCKAAERILELELELKLAEQKLQDWLKNTPLGGDFAAWERQLKALHNQVMSLQAALALQRKLYSEALHQQEQKMGKSSPKKMKNFGYRRVEIQFFGGLKIHVFVRYWCRNQARADKAKGCFYGLLLLGIYDHCTPAMASEVAQLAAALSSFEEAQARLQQMGVHLSTDTIAKIAYQFAQRARDRQRLEGMGITGSLAGKRVVISTDGGRLRIRTNKRGKKTKKDRQRFRTDWREPKLLVIYVVNEEGRIDRSFSAVLDGTLKGSDAVFRLLEFYLSELDVQQAERVLFIADGAKWIWNRVAKLWKRLGLKPEQCMELVDFYHVSEHLHALSKLRKDWKSAVSRKRWVTTQCNRLLAGELQKFEDEIRRFCKGHRAAGWRRERDYLLRNAAAGRLNYAIAKARHLPMGSGAMESTVRRVVNMRMKGASIFWTKEHAEQMLLLRAYYKSKRWKTLENKAFASPMSLAT